MRGAIQIIDRYLGRQVITATLLGVAVLSLVFVFGNLFKEVFELLVDKNLPVASVLKFMAYILPFSLTFTIPWGFLTAVLLVFGRLSADNELVSFRMAGMSMQRICRPVFALAIGFAALSFWINTTITPRAQAEMKQAMYDMAIDDPMALFVPDRVLGEFPGYSIYAESRKGDELQNLEIFVLDDYGNAVQFLKADRARIAYEKLGDKLVLSLDHAVSVRKNPSNPKNLADLQPGMEAGLTHVEIPLAPLRADANRLRPSTLDTGELRARLADDDLKSSQKRMIKTEISKRYSFSLACFTFALIGIPLGVTAQRRETSVGFAFSMVIAVVYFLFIIIADTIKDKPAAQYLMWLPNVVFIALGVWLFVRLSKK